MSWGRFDDRARENLKVRRAGTEAFALWTAAILWCCEHATDGRVPKELLPDVWRPIGESFDHAAVARVCVENRLFVDDGDAYLVHDFLEFNPSKAEQEDKKRKAAERARRHRRRKAAAVTRDATRDGAGDDQRDATGDVTRDDARDVMGDEPRTSREGKPAHRHASRAHPRPQPVPNPNPSPSTPLPPSSDASRDVDGSGKGAGDVAGLSEWTSWARRVPADAGEAQHHFERAFAMRYAAETAGQHLWSAEGEKAKAAALDLWQACNGVGDRFAASAEQVIDLYFLDVEVARGDVKAPGGFLKKHIGRLFELAVAGEEPGQLSLRDMASRKPRRGFVEAGTDFTEWGDADLVAGGGCP
ncbi:MAG: hypothetical protein VYE22_09815 [Myxococcota bacterium]|nr:hypothetical protein [Myxococcota bacterium]